MRTPSVDPAGNRVVDSKGYNADGSLAFSITSVTNAAGSNVTNSYDDSGGSKTETRSNFSGSNVATAGVVNSQQLVATAGD